MGPALVFVLVGLGGIGLIALLLTLVAKQSERAHQNARELARRLGLQLEPQTKRFGCWPAPRAAGRYRGKHTEFYTYSTGSGKSRERWAALAVRPASAGALTFHIARQGFGTKIAELFGAREITVGDAKFDGLWFVQTNQPDFLRAALIPELRERLNAAVDTSGRSHRASLKLEKETVVYTEAGDLSDEKLCERMARMVEVLTDFADVAEVFAQTRLGN